MRFTYTYKTSDGVRHRGEVSAESHNAAFAALRAEGIRPIRVAEVPSGAEGRVRPRGPWLAAAGLGAAALVLILGLLGPWARVFSGRAAEEDAASGEMAGARASLLWEDAGAEPASEQAKLRLLLARARAIEESHEAALRMLSALNPAIADKGEFLSARYGACEDFLAALAKIREETRTLFRGVDGLFPAEASEARRVARRRYGELMARFDASEDNALMDEALLLFLEENQAAWTLQGGRIVFTDEGVGHEFHARQQDDGSTRWERDFAAERREGVESGVVSLERTEKRKGEER